jgi:ribosomal protein L11 methylase PrmA
LPVYSEKLASKGKLFLSGFFKTDIAELVEVAEMLNFKFSLSKNENEWAMLLFEKK